MEKSNTLNKMQSFNVYFDVDQLGELNDSLPSEILKFENFNYEEVKGNIVSIRNYPKTRELQKMMKEAERDNYRDKDFSGFIGFLWMLKDKHIEYKNICPEN